MKINDIFITKASRSEEKNHLLIRYAYLLLPFLLAWKLVEWTIVKFDLSEGVLLRLSNI